MTSSHDNNNAVLEELPRSRSGMLASVSRQAWDKHDSSPGRLPAFPAREITTEHGLYSLYRDFLWIALSWAKAGEYKMRLSFSCDGAVGANMCGVVAFGGRGAASIRGESTEALEKVRQALFAYAAADGFATNWKRSTIAWMSDKDYEREKAGAFIKKPARRVLCSGLVEVDSSVASRRGA